MDGVLVKSDVSQGFTYGLDLHVRIVELDDLVATTLEIDAEVQATDGKRTQADHEEANADDERGLAETDEVVVLVLQEVACPCSGEGDFSVFGQHAFENQTADEDGRGQRSEDTDAEGDSEAVDRTRTQDNQDDTSDQGGDVTVDNG